MITPKHPITNAESKGRNAPMTKARLEEIKGRCGNATEGLWEIKHPLLNDPDDVFIAHARTDIPDLVAALEEAWAEVRLLKEKYKLAGHAIYDLKREAAEALSDAQYEYISRETIAEQVGEIDDLKLELAQQHKEYSELAQKYAALVKRKTK